jgi:hypothetical protein
LIAEEAFRAWGDYDRDDPFPLFAGVRGLGPVHPVTLADGHAAWPWWGTTKHGPCSTMRG